jgi:hypothetical protein
MIFEEKIVWKPYPEKEPEHQGRYYVKTEYYEHGKLKEHAIATACWYPGWYHGDWCFIMIDKEMAKHLRVVAYAKQEEK